MLILKIKPLAVSRYGFQKVVSELTTPCKSLTLTSEP
jgi:hypothetical protein